MQLSKDSQQLQAHPGPEDVKSRTCSPQRVLPDLTTTVKRLIVLLLLVAPVSQTTCFDASSVSTASSSSRTNSCSIPARLLHEHTHLRHAVWFATPPTVPPTFDSSPEGNQQQQPFCLTS